METSFKTVPKGPEPTAGSFLNLCRSQGIKIERTTAQVVAINIDNPKITPKKGDFCQIKEMRVNNRKYEEKCQRCFLESLCEQCPAWSWMEHGVLDEPVEYLCEIAHAEATWLGLLKEGEKAWEINVVDSNPNTSESRPK